MTSPAERELQRESRVGRQILAVGAILTASVMLSLPLLTQGLPFADDSEEHGERYVLFASQFWRGELYPRWLGKFNNGLGSPVMFVYGALGYYVPAILRPILRFPSDGVQESREIAFGLWIALALSGLTAFWWLRSVLARFYVAVFGALLYMAIPYHLAIDLYKRDAVAEVWAFVWMPLVLYFAFRMVRSPGATSVVGLAVSYGLLVFTHLLTSLIFTPVAIAIPLVFEKGSRRLTAAMQTALALGLGAALAGVYLFPALMHEKYVSPSRLGQLHPHLYYTANFLSLRRDWAEPGGRGDYQWKISWLALSALAACLCALFLKSNWRKDLTAGFWAAIALVSSAMMFHSSDFLWRLLPQLQAIQFPYRFNTILSIATVALIALALDSMRLPIRGWRILLAAGIVAAIALWFVSDAKTILTFTPWRAKTDQTLLTSELVRDVLMPGWTSATDPEYQQTPGMFALSQRAKVEGAGLRDASLEHLSSRQVRLTENGSGGWVTIPLLFYHGWTAVAENGEQLTLKAQADGLAVVETPPGSHQIRITLPWGTDEKTGLALSSIAALVCLALLVTAKLRPLATPSDTLSSAGHHGHI